LLRRIGGASGIGEGFVRLACKNGANVVFGDRNSELGEAVARETGATFVKADVSVYADQVALFEAAYRKHGRVDHAIANAGVYEPKGLFDHSLDLESVQKVGVSLRVRCMKAWLKFHRNPQPSLSTSTSVVHSSSRISLQSISDRVLLQETTSP
jgi:NAD(P)-dependent dehydrogenase (short-subunit alcohol dehydrogenase family)